MGPACFAGVGLRRRQVLALLATTAGVGRAASADAPKATAGFQAELLRTGLYLIRGGGGHSLMRLSPAGALLVDGKAPGQYRPFMSQLRRINKLSDLPIRVLALTGAGDAQAANAGLFAAAGVAVLAQDRVLAALPTPATASGAAVRVPFEASYRLALGGVEAHLTHVGPGRTDGDTAVLFPDLRIAAIGELAAGEPAAQPGGNRKAWAQALDRVLALEADLFVPSSGDPLTREELQAYQARVLALPLAGLDAMAATART